MTEYFGIVIVIFVTFRLKRKMGSDTDLSDLKKQNYSPLVIKKSLITFGKQKHNRCDSFYGKKPCTPCSTNVIPCIFLFRVSDK